MPRYKVVSDRCTLGAQGATVTVDDGSAVNVRALVRARHLEPLPDKPAVKKAAKKKGDA